MTNNPSTIRAGKTDRDLEYLLELGKRGAADAALRGHGPALEAELLTRLASEKANHAPSVTKLAHIYFALGMVNWYMERPAAAWRAFASAAGNYRKRADRLRSLANQMLSMCQAGERLGEREAAYLKGRADSLDERYSMGLLQLALGKVEDAIKTWKSIVEAPPPTIEEAPVAVPAVPGDTRRYAAEALVSALVAEERTDEAKAIWDQHLPNFPDDEKES